MNCPGTVGTRPSVKVWDDWSLQGARWAELGALPQTAIFMRSPSGSGGPKPPGSLRCCLEAYRVDRGAGQLQRRKQCGGDADQFDVSTTRTADGSGAGRCE